jgi:phosphoribosyl-ATP pyrophosphohydrolase
LTVTLIISDSGKNIVDVVKTNEKGFKKSLENKILWFLHEETGRLIPYGEISGGVKLLDIKKNNEWIEAVIEGEEKSADSYGEKKSGETGISETVIPDVIQRLELTIRERSEKLPEGSYTTHLFKSGVSKIRKKTGEEAIELILAENRDEIIYESADLIYHMMVLFQAEKIEFKNVLKELEKRM